MKFPPDSITLLDKEAITNIIGREPSEAEWEKIYEWVTTDDNMWSVIDQCIKDTIFECVDEGFLP